MNYLESSIGYITAGAIAIALLMVPGGPAAAQRHSGADVKATGGIVSIVRQTSGRFRDINVAYAEGYVKSLDCISGSAGGAMGQHLMKPALVDGVLDVTQPEMLVYEPGRNDRMRLVAVDFLVFYDSWHANNDLPPALEGQSFFLLDSPNRYGAPVFYTLHVWAFKYNPNGAFAMWNPDVSCTQFGPYGGPY
ncbi:MAG: hypothetical protein L0I62_03810 [Gammaproteobacteria bacterium]|nr:hypothetical protein [Gammaproteobacteria bacterium]